MHAHHTFHLSSNGYTPVTVEPNNRKTSPITRQRTDPQCLPYLCLLLVCSNLREVIHGKLLTTHMEEAHKKEHLKEVTQRQQSAEQQILKLEAELAEEQKRKEDLVSA